MNIRDYDDFILDGYLLKYKTFASLVSCAAWIVAIAKYGWLGVLAIVPIGLCFVLGMMLVGFTVGLIWADRIRQELAIQELQRELAAGNITEAEAKMVLDNIDEEEIKERTTITAVGPQFGTFGDVKLFEYIDAKLEKTGDLIRFDFFCPVSQLVEDDPNQNSKWYIDYDSVRYTSDWKQQ